ncbi:MAG TPA: ZntA protein, partial [Pasteurellaceae bacterium]|nr:ZntA protein [Pasteurellaceae bacterium]
IKNVKQILEAIPSVESAEVTLNFAKINGESDARVLIEAIVNAGYGAQAAQPDFVLSLSGLSCG